MAGSGVMEVNDANFDQEVLKSEQRTKGKSKAPGSLLGIAGARAALPQNCPRTESRFSCAE